MRLNVVSNFSYTIETVFQAVKKKMRDVSVVISTNSDTRESRLFSSIGQFIYLSAKMLLQTYVMYSPLRAFFYMSFALMVLKTDSILEAS